MKTLRSTASERADLLAQGVLFANLPPVSLQPLARAAELRQYDAGEYLFRQDAPAQGFTVIAGGRVHVLRSGPDGREQILQTFSRGDVCAEVPVFQGGTYPASGCAETVARILYVPADAFRELGRRQPDMLLNMLATLSLRLRAFVTLIDDLSLKDVPARTAKYLLDSAVHQGVRAFQLPVTKTVAAARIGTVPETLSRVLGKMQRRNLITVKGRAITILDRDALVALAAGMKL